VGLMAWGWVMGNKELINVAWPNNGLAWKTRWFQSKYILWSSRSTPLFPYRAYRFDYECPGGNLMHIILHVTIKTHSSESRGQERAKWITKNKTHDEQLCVFYMSKHFVINHSQYISWLVPTFKPGLSSRWIS